MKRKFRWEKYTIPNLTNVLVVLMLIVNLLDIIFNINPPIFQIQMLFTSNWWQIFLFPFRVTTQLLSLIIFLYIFWVFGNTLENELGFIKYNLYIFLGYIFILLGTYFFPINAYYVYISVFLAVSYLFPDMEILLFFVLPVKMKWIGIFTVAFLIYDALSSALLLKSIGPFIGIILGLLNLVLMIFLPDLIQNKNRIKKMSFNTLQKKKHPIHRCTVCNITEFDDPQMDFRYCEDCKGDYEYCMKHLYNHNHKQ